MAQIVSSGSSSKAGSRAIDQTWVWFNGDVMQYGDVHLGLMTHGLHYGTGCFEGIRAYWSAQHEQLFVFRLEEHYARMEQSAKVLRMKLPRTPAELAEITRELLRKNGFHQDVYIRPLAYKSDEVVGVRLHDLHDGFAIYPVIMGEYVDISRGLRCMVSSWRRVDDLAAPARAKITGAYINSALAKSEAMENGYDEAIMLTGDGHVSEGSAENIFMLRNGGFYTPPPSDNILEGITRATVMELLTAEMNLDVRERSIDRTELYGADEVFLCGTGAQISPVVEVDRRTVGAGTPGEMTMKLQQLYFSVCRGEVKKYQKWLTPVF